MATASLTPLVLVGVGVYQSDEYDCWDLWCPYNVSTTVFRYRDASEMLAC
jgi:hypothetical protein